MTSLIEEMEAAGATDDPAPAKKPRMPRAIKSAVESKRDRFIRIAEPRVQRAIDAIRIVGLLGGTNKSRYDYGPSDVDAITAELTEAVAAAGDKLQRKPTQMKMFALPRKQANGGE